MSLEVRVLAVGARRFLKARGKVSGPESEPSFLKKELSNGDAD